MPVSVLTRLSVTPPALLELGKLHWRMSCETYGFGERHCQKLYGLDIPNSAALLAANGIAASPPFEDGDGR